MTIITDFDATTTIIDGDQLPEGFWQRYFAASIPIGSVIAWLKSYTNTPQILPAGWVECGGSVLSDSDSVYDGETIPDLNGDNRFLRGASTSGGTGGVATLDLSHTHTCDTLCDFDTYPEAYLATSIAANTEFSAQTNLPVYYNVVWIMRVK